VSGASVGHGHVSRLENSDASGSRLRDLVPLDGEYVVDYLSAYLVVFATLAS
jgi:hypothetical protein